MDDPDDVEPDRSDADLAWLASLSPEVEALARKMTDAMRTPLAPGDPRRHHYIPQFLLRRFADQSENMVKVHLEDPGTRIPTRVIDTAVMADLYTTVDIEIGATVAVERLLADLDGRASGAIARLAYGVLFPPQVEDRMTLSLWLALLHLRGPRARRWMEALADQAIKMQLSMIHDRTDATQFLEREGGHVPSEEEVVSLLKTIEELDDLEFAPHQNELVRMMLKVGLDGGALLLPRHYAVVQFPEQGLLLTDNPLIYYQRPENRSPLLGVGLGNADELWMPLDRSTALILHSDDSVGDRVLAAPPSHSVDDFNQAVVGQAHLEIFSHPDDVGRIDRVRLPNPHRPLGEVVGGDFVKAATDGINAEPRRKKHRRYRGEADSDA